MLFFHKAHLIITGGGVHVADTSILRGSLLVWPDFSPGTSAYHVRGPLLATVQVPYNLGRRNFDFKFWHSPHLMFGGVKWHWSYTGILLRKSFRIEL